MEVPLTIQDAEIKAGDNDFFFPPLVREHSFNLQMQ